MSQTTTLDRIGVGIDTARYGHRVAFLRPDRQPAAKPMTVLESRAGYQALHERLQLLHQQHPQAHFHVRIDAAGPYAANLEHFLRGLALPIPLSIGEPKRNKDYQKAHFPNCSPSNRSRACPATWPKRSCAIWWRRCVTASAPRTSCGVCSATPTRRCRPLRISTWSPSPASAWPRPPYSSPKPSISTASPRPTASSATLACFPRKTAPELISSTTR